MVQGGGQTGEGNLGVITIETTFKSMSLDQIPKGVSIDGKEGRSEA